MGLATINIKFQADLRGFSTEMQNSMRRIGAFGNQMSALGKGMSLYLTAPIVGAGAAAIKFASDYDESMNKVDVAFDKSSASVKEFAKTSLESFGIAEGTALNMASAFGDMGTSLGISQDKAAKMSTTLVGLAGDLSSFKNISIDIANTALNGIFTGETESLKKLGIVMTEANLQNFAFSKGIKTKIADMDQASKVNLRYAYIMSVTKNSQGDFIRTGGGAANQMRIFQESLKQVAQQFGSVMIPAFTKAIRYVNELIKSFGNLSEGTKETIVIVAAVVAATGPLLTVFGSMLTFVPNLITKFNALKDSFLALKTVIVANPYIALGAAIVAIGLALYGWYSNTQKVVSSQQQLNEAVAQGNKNAATEVGALDKLFAAATNVKGSITETREAREKIQEMYPAYFKNLDDESIKNGTAKTSYDELRQAIFNKARAMAIDNKLQENANERISTEIELQDKKTAAIEKIKQAQKALKAAGIDASTNPNDVNGGAYAYGRLTAALTSAKLEYKNVSEEIKKFTADAVKSDQSLLNAKEIYASKTGKLLENEALKTDAVTDALSGVAEGIEKVKKANLEPIDITINSSVGGNSAAAYDAQIAKLREFQTEVATTAQQVKLAEDAIKQVEFEKALQFDPASLIEISGGFENLVTEMQSKAGGLQAVADSINGTMLNLTDMVNQAIQGLAVNAAVGFGEAIGGIVSGAMSMGDAMKGMLGLVGAFMKDLGKSLIQTAIAAEAFKKLFAHPAVGIAAGIALVALGSIVQSKFSAGPKTQAFANGGIVGGQSYYGDKIMARVNSAEMISNTDQQKRIWGAMNSGGDSSTIIPDIRISGQDLIVVFDRANKRNNRLS